MKLSYNPYLIFQHSKTPAGLYARRKWLEEDPTKQWQSDYDETVAALMAEQLDDGSWRQSALVTIEHLFGLHLTVRSCKPEIDAALNWLLEKVHAQTGETDTLGKGMSTAANFLALPFIVSETGMLLTSATLFLASIFGRDNDQTVLNVYRGLSNKGEKKKGNWGDWVSTHNVFRAMVVHPEFAACRATVWAADHLANAQTKSGIWGDNLPFFQTLNALAHLNLPQADKQLERAFQWLYENQNSDGTWGDCGSEWNSFLAIHALKNKGLL